MNMRVGFLRRWAFIGVVGILFVSLAVRGATGTELKSNVARWYEADRSRRPQLQVDVRIQSECPDIHLVLAALKFAVLNGAYWKDAKWKHDVDIHELRQAVARLLDDPKLRLSWNQKQVALDQQPRGAKTSGVASVDKDEIVFNQVAFCRGSKEDPITPRSAYEVAKTIMHELAHVWDKRGDWVFARTTDGLAGAGLAYDFEKFLAEEVFASENLRELAQVFYGEFPEGTAIVQVAAIPDARHPVLIPEGMQVVSFGQSEVDGWVPFRFSWTCPEGYEVVGARIVADIRPIGQLIETDTLHCLDDKGEGYAIYDEFEELPAEVRDTYVFEVKDVKRIAGPLAKGTLRCALQDDTALYGAILQLFVRPRGGASVRPGDAFLPGLRPAEPYELNPASHPIEPPPTAQPEIPQPAPSSQRAFEAYQGGDLPGAIGEYTRVLEQEPTNYGAYVGRATSYSWSGDYASAVQDYRSALALTPLQGDPSVEQVRISLAGVLLVSGQLRDAGQEIDILEESPVGGTAWTIMLRGQYLLKNDPGDVKATLTLAQARKVDPNIVSQVYDWALSLLQYQRYEHALLLFDTLERMDPNATGIYYGRGVAFAGLGKRTEAIACYRRYLEFDSTSEFAERAHAAIAELER